MKIDPMYIILLVVIAGVFFINLFFYLLNQNRRTKEENTRLKDENSKLQMQNTLIQNTANEKKHSSALCERSLTKDFTDSELKVAAILVEGLEDKEIADKLKKSIYSINTHIRNMREKAGCRNTKELIAYLLRNDIV